MDAHYTMGASLHIGAYALAVSHFPYRYLLVALPRLKLHLIIFTVATNAHLRIWFSLYQSLIEIAFCTFPTLLTHVPTAKQINPRHFSNRWVEVAISLIDISI